MSHLSLRIAKVVAESLSLSLPYGKPTTLSIADQLKKSDRRVQKISDGYMTFVAGRTGMGKSKLIREIIKHKLSLYPSYNVYHLDTKKRGDFSERDGKIILSDIAPDAYKTGGNRMVWQPLGDRKDEYSKFFERILQAGLPAIVDIDECINMKFAGDTVPRGLEILIAQGRLPGIDVIGGTQRVAGSPTYLRTQATNLISFDVTGRYDVSTMLDELRLEGQKRLNLRKYQFYFLNRDVDSVARKFNHYLDVLQFIH